MRYLLLILLFSGCAQTLVGPTGPQGPSGKNGYSIVSTTIPDTSSSCTNGGNVILMAQDSDQTGQWAPDDLNQSSILVCNGTNGTNGTNSTPVTVVQFCENTTTYPSTFSEVGVCLGGQLYAVYSENDGFLSLIPPGTYSSDGINSSCTFTVGANCTVSQ